MHIIIIILASLIIYGVIQYRLHLKNLYKIPIRIHVNGTRGKSSVTRLIGAGLRAGGVKTMAKTTGTLPRIIMEDGSEIPIYRRGRANIIEQLKIIKFARENEIKALVIECMAVNPTLQWVTEHKMVRSTIGVITNIRLDHIEEMGKTLEAITEAIFNTVRRGSTTFTAEKVAFPYMEKLAKQRNGKLIQTDDTTIDDHMMEGFSYVEHKENLALALKVCEEVGVDRETALKGMHAAIPDPGALEILQIDFFNKHIRFANAFAANDPTSTAMIWDMIISRFDDGRTKIIVLNTRGDRLERSQQLLEVIANEMEGKYDHIILIGDYTDKVEETGAHFGIDEKKMFSLGQIPAEDVFEKLLDLTHEKSLAIGIGNMGGLGNEVFKYLEHRAKLIV